MKGKINVRSSLVGAPGHESSATKKMRYSLPQGTSLDKQSMIFVSQANQAGGNAQPVQEFALIIGEKLDRDEDLRNNDSFRQG